MKKFKLEEHIKIQFRRFLIESRLKKQSEVDRILDKINQSGIQSLSSDERELLGSPDSEELTAPEAQDSVLNVIARVMSDKSIPQERKQEEIDRILDNMDLPQEPAPEPQEIKQPQYSHELIRSLKANHGQQLQRKKGSQEGRIQFWDKNGRHIMTLDIPNTNSGAQERILYMDENLFEEYFIKRFPEIFPHKRWLGVGMYLFDMFGYPKPHKVISTPIEKAK